MSGSAAGIRKMAETNKSVSHSPGRRPELIKAASSLAVSYQLCGYNDHSFYSRIAFPI